LRRKINSHLQEREEFPNEKKQRYEWMKIILPNARNQIQSLLRIVFYVDRVITKIPG